MSEKSTPLPHAQNMLKSAGIGLIDYPALHSEKRRFLFTHKFVPFLGPSNDGELSGKTDKKECNMYRI